MLCARRAQAPAAEARFVRQNRAAPSRSSTRLLVKVALYRAARLATGARGTLRLRTNVAGWCRVGSAPSAVVNRMERDAVSASP